MPTANPYPNLCDLPTDKMWIFLKQIPMNWNPKHEVVKEVSSIQNVSRLKKPHSFPDVLLSLFQGVISRQNDKSPASAFGEIFPLLKRFQTWGAPVVSREDQRLNGTVPSERGKRKGKQRKTHDICPNCLIIIHQPRFPWNKRSHFPKPKSYPTWARRSMGV